MHVFVYPVKFIQSSTVFCFVYPAKIIQDFLLFFAQTERELLTFLSAWTGSLVIQNALMEV